MTMTGPVFVIAVFTLTVVEPVVDPLMTKIAIRSVPARRGGVAPVTTFGRFAHHCLDLKRYANHACEYLMLATLVVWLAAMLADLILPVLLMKKAVEQRKT